MGGRISASTDTGVRGDELYDTTPAMREAKQVALDKEFTRLIGDEVIALDDSFWQTSFKSLGYLLNLPAEHTLDSVLRNACVDLAKNTKKTRHFYKFVIVICTRLEHAQDFNNEEEVEPLSVLLFIARLIFMFAIGTFEYPARISFLEFEHEIDEKKGSVDEQKEGWLTHAKDRSKPSHDVTQDLGLRLIQSLFGVISRLNEGKGCSDQFRLEVINVLVVLASTQIYGPLEASYRNPFLDRMLTPEPYVVVSNTTATSSAAVLPYDAVLRFLFFTLADIKSSSASSSSSSSSSSSTSSSVGAATADVEGGLREESKGETQQRHGFKRILDSIRGLGVALLRLPSSIYNYLFTPQSSEHVVCAGAALLALILVRQRPLRIRDTRVMNAWRRPNVNDDENEPWEACGNPFRAALQRVVDSAYHDDHKQTTTTTTATIPIPFAAVYDMLGKHLREEWTHLLFYALMNDNPVFKEFIYAKSDLDILVVPLLRRLYEKAESLHSFEEYLLVINALQLTQDAGFCENAFKNIQLDVNSIHWYWDSALKEVSLGSLMMLTLLRTLKLNVLNPRMNDWYVHTNCLASVVNLSPHAEHMDTHCAVALTKLVDILAKRLVRMQTSSSSDDSKKRSSSSSSTTTHQTETKQQSLLRSDNNNNNNNNSNSNGNGLVENESSLMDFIRLMLETIVACICAKPLTQTKNIYLLYWLMVCENVNNTLQSLQRFPALREMSTRLANIVAHFNTIVKEHTAQSGNSEPNAVLEILAQDIQRWHIPPEYIFEPTKFTYVEEPTNSAEFFLPYIWCVMHNMRIPWPAENIVLFQVEDGEEQEDDVLSPMDALNEDETINNSNPEDLV